MFLGIDFSGNAEKWRERCLNPSVWIARIEETGGSSFRLTELGPVQGLRGDGSPFERLVALLRAGKFVAAGIDAPFSIPVRHLPPGGHEELLRRVEGFAVDRERPFGRGEALVRLAEEAAALESKKPYRETERDWVGRNVNTRSTLWNGARGGAPFTVACLTLLARAGRPIWPWQSGPGMLVEAFPAAQLQSWGLPFSLYAKEEQESARGRILDGLARRVAFDREQRARMLECADALDAVVAAFGAVAAARIGGVAVYPADGRIAVL